MLEDRDIATEEARANAAGIANESVDSFGNESQETAVMDDDNDQMLDENMDSERAPVVRNMFGAGGGESRPSSAKRRANQ